MLTPFVKLFETPKGKYVYDVGKNEILSISDITYHQLQELVSGEYTYKEVDTSNNPEMDELLSEGYLSDVRPSTIEHPLTSAIPYLLSRKIEKITLQLTQDCNFRCDYCIYSEDKNKKQRAHSKSKMTWETAKNAIEFFVSHSQDSEMRNIGFYGGEPLLEFPLIKQIVEYAEARMAGKPLSMNITTNGALLTDEVVQFFDQHNISVLLSFDGTREAQDKHRRFSDGRGTYDIVIKHLNRIRESNPLFFKRLQINSVISNDNDIDAVCELANELVDIPRDHFQANSATNTDKIIKPRPESVMKSEYHSFLAYLSICGLYPERELSPISIRRLNALKNDARKMIPCFGMSDSVVPSGPCIPGKDRLFISTEGNFFPCERVNESKLMCIGSLSKGFDYQKVSQLLNIGKLTESKCKECWAMRHCSICAQACDGGLSLSASEKATHCIESLYNAEIKLRAIIFLYEHTN